MWEHGWDRSPTLLVQSESITSFPPTVLYIHGNSSAVPLYFYADIPAIGIHRGDLFGQLTVAGHGVGFTEADVPEFEAAETEAEQQRGRLPLQTNPIPHVTIVDEVSNTPTPTPTSAPWIGDCNGDQAATVDEILILVNIVLGSAQASACPHGIPSGAEVDIAVIIQAVNHALTNCPAS
jgi:hypothetical protein